MRLRNSDRTAVALRVRVTEMKRLNWIDWVFIVAALCLLLSAALPYLKAIAIGLTAVLA